MLPLGLMAGLVVGSAEGRRAVYYYVARLARATVLGKAAVKDGQV